ncbi:MAG: hypothetical protein ACREFI_03455 [Stellaceae bacterium]
MRYICDAPGDKTWFRLETVEEAAAEALAMRHAVEKHFCREMEKAKRSYQPVSKAFFEQEIGLKAHIQREMPLFLTLRDGEGAALVTAMLPPGGKEDAAFRIIIVGPDNGDPYPDHAPAIEALGRHLSLSLERSRCFPYQRQ